MEAKTSVCGKTVWTERTVHRTARKARTWFTTKTEPVSKSACNPLPFLAHLERQVDLAHIHPQHNCWWKHKSNQAQRHDSFLAPDATYDVLAYSPPPSPPSSVSAQAPCISLRQLSLLLSSFHHAVQKDGKERGGKKKKRHHENDRRTADRQYLLERIT